MGIAKFSKFIPKVEITVNFGNHKVLVTDSQCIESSNSDQSRTTCYFLGWGMCHNLISPNVDKDKKNIQNLSFRLRLEIAHPTGRGQGVVDNGCFYLNSRSRGQT